MDTTNAALGGITPDGLHFTTIGNTRLAQLTQGDTPSARVFYGLNYSLAPTFGGGNGVLGTATATGLLSSNGVVGDAVLIPSYGHGLELAFSPGNTNDPKTQVTFATNGAMTTQGGITNIGPTIIIPSGVSGSGVQIGVNIPGLTNVFYTNQTLDFPSTAATNFSDLPVVTNAILKDGAIVSWGAPSGSVPQGGYYSCWVSNGGGNGVLWMRFNNNTAGAINPSSGLYRYQVSDY